MRSVEIKRIYMFDDVHRIQTNMLNNICAYYYKIADLIKIGE